MKKIYLLIAFVLMLGACGWTKKDLGMAKSTPDDGNMARKERLVVPPDFDVRPQ
ncbi:MAG: hypothetical protein J6W96_04205 [Alphaproteobacteria bacterium]|nr:hypothetical protein [Alphaproteobacteria bacterium]